MVMGAVMLGGIISGKPPVSLSQATPIARLTSEYNVFVLPASSPFKTMKDVIEQIGVLMRRYDFPTAPVVVGMILGPLAEAQMRNALSIGEGRWTVFLERPMSLFLLLVVLSVLVLPRLLKLRKR